MKKSLMLLGLVCCTTLLYAQQEKVVVKKSKEGTSVKVETEEDVSVEEGKGTARIRLVGIEIKVVDDKVKVEYGKEDRHSFSGNWGGIEFGVNGYVNEDYSGYSAKNFMDLRPLKSISVRFNLLQFDFGLQKQKKSFGFVTGLGLESKNFRFENPYTLQNIDGTTQPKLLTYDRLKKSKLHVLYVTLPIMFEKQFQTENNRKFHVGIGIEGGYRLSSHTKIKYKDGGSWEKDKNRNSFNLNDFKLDARVQVGYRGIHLFCNYGLVNLFEKNKGPKLTPITLGISF